MAVFTTIDDSSAYFQAALYTGNSNLNTIVNDGNSDLAPDLVWGKCRSTFKTHYWYDTSRGTEKRIESDNTSVEDINTNGLYIFQSDGFKLASGNTENDNGETYVAWQWKANGGTTTSFSESGNNPGGNRQTNTAAGFSIISYTGTGANASCALAHGLGKAPELVIFKRRNNANVWAVYHQAIGVNEKLVLNSTDGEDADGAFMNGTIPNATNIYVGGTSVNTNANNGTYICYAWTSIQGYSKFGKYVGNSSTDGPFVYTGFKPAFVLQKQISANGNGWFITDSRRDPFNAATGKYLRADEIGSEGTTSKILDLLSNGFKVRNNDSAVNGSGHTYIYMAFAENPFTTSTGVPACAR